MAYSKPCQFPYDVYDYKCDSKHAPIVRWIHYWKSSFLHANIIKCEHLETFKCSICQCYPRDPIKLTRCGHIFCRRCAFSKLDDIIFFQSAHCAICNVVYYYYQMPLLSDIDEKLFTQYNSALISCVHGCGKVASPSRIQKHEYWNCERREVMCPFTECPDIMKQSELAAHIEECEFMRIYCVSCNRDYTIENQKEWCNCSQDNSHDENGHPFYNFKSCAYDW